MIWQQGAGPHVTSKMKGIVAGYSYAINGFK